jgi:hypothetical protein
MYRWEMRTVISSIVRDNFRDLQVNWKIKLKLFLKINVWKDRVDSSGSGFSLTTRFCEHGEIFSKKDAGNFFTS